MGAGRSRAEAVANMCTNDRRGLASARPGFAEVPWLRLRRRQSFLGLAPGRAHLILLSIESEVCWVLRMKPPSVWTHFESLKDPRVER
jgi:hypothetical protein